MSPDPTNVKQPIETSFTSRDLVSLLIIASVGAILVLPLFLRGFPDGDDVRHHYRWAYYFWEELKEGAVYPRWLAGANRGYGSPAMFYYPPFTFYVVAAFNVVARNLLLSIKLSCALAMMASGVSMYKFSRPMLSRGACVIAALLYMTAPYHIFELWRVNALSEFWSLVWIPLILDAVRRIAQGQGWRASAYLGLSYGLLLLTNVPISVIVTLILPIFVLILTRDKRKLIQVGAGIALGLGISAIFLVSVLFETKYVHIDRILEDRYSQAFAFEDLSAFSWTNLLSAANYRKFGAYRREANLTSIGVTLLFILASIVLMIERRVVQQDRARATLIRATWIVAFVSLLMTTRISEPLWSAVRSLQYLQSPFRWLVPATFATALLTAIALQIGRSASRRIVFGGLLGTAILINIGFSAHIATQRPVPLEKLEAERLDKDVPEYAPLWWDEQFHEELEQSPAVVDDVDADLQAIDDSGVKQSYEVNARTQLTIRFRSVFFPGWAARIDGNRVGVQRSKEGNIQLIVPAGEHVVTLRFEETWRHVKAGIVSAVSVLVLGVIFWRARRVTSKT